MPVQIRLPDRFQLVLDKDGIRLPDITLVPSPENQPHLTSVSVRLGGPPGPLLQQLQGAYKELTFARPHKLTGEAALPRPRVRPEGPLPGDLSASLQVVVHYYDSDPAGNAAAPAAPAGGKDPLLKTAQATAKLYTVVTCAVTVQPPELLLLDGSSDPARVRILVERGPPGARPVVRLESPDALPHPDVRHQLEDALRNVPQPVAVSSSERVWQRHRPASPTRGAALTVSSSQDTLAAYELPLVVRLGEEARQAVLKVSRPGVLSIPLRTEMSDGASCQHVLKLEVRQVPFPGWLAIDFGTSNSTVTLYDQRIRPSVYTLPVEQEMRLRELFRRWLDSPPSDALPGVPEAEWRAFLEQVGGNLGGKDAEHARRVFRESSGEQLQEAIRQLETCLGPCSDQLARAANRRLQEIYSEALHVPPLEAFCLVPVELDATLKQKEVLSEMEVKDLGPPLRVLLGNRAKQNRLQSIAQAPDAAALQAVRGAFHHSPKRYLGQNDRLLPVQLKEQSGRLPVRQLVQAAWGHLLELTEEFRQRNAGRFSAGPFRHAIITYPTVAPPAVRKELQEMIRALGITQVQTDYDEAVSVAIFFLLREFGVAPDIGIEAFRARCRAVEGKEVQNVLIFDIGGGTTDVAVIQLRLAEQDPWKVGEDRGAGGRYYVITPQLLGSSGNLQLGGELASLCLFRLLKAVLADHLLTLVQGGKADCETLRTRLEHLPDRFRAREGGPYRAGALVEAVDTDNPTRESQPAYQEALQAAESVLPTRWALDPSRLQAFYTLWEHVDGPEPDGVKITLGKRRDPDAGAPPPFLLKGEKVLDLLQQCGHDVTVADPRTLQVAVSHDQFRRAVHPVVKEAVSIAKKLIETRLPGDKVDWMILSGKTCNLQVVHDELKAEFANSPQFSWSPERITFEREYAKLATSIGACYAEYLRRYVFRPEDAKEELRAGFSQLYFDVKNLFCYLSSSFRLINVARPIFDHGRALFQLDAEPLGKARTDDKEWLPLQLSLDVYRIDYAADGGKFCGFYKTDAELGARLGWGADEVQRRLRVQFEIDNRLQIRLFFCQAPPHFAPREAGVFHDVGGALVGVLTPTLPAVAPARPARGAQPAAPVAQRLPERLGWEVAVNVLEGQGAESARTVFPQDAVYDRVFHLPEGVAGGPVCRGLVSEPLPPLPMSRKYTFFARQNRGPWQLLGEIAPAAGDTPYPRYYRATLDQSGVLGIHLGEVPYWTCADPSGLTEPGRVFRDQLRSDDRDRSEERDPFCGRH